MHVSCGSILAQWKAKIRGGDCTAQARKSKRRAACSQHERSDMRDDAWGRDQDIAKLIRATRHTQAEHPSPKSVRFNATRPIANNVRKSELPFMFTRISAVTLHAMLLAVIFIAAATGTRQAQAQQGGPAFTEAQVERGRALYQKNCQDCHGTQLDNGEFGGAPLKDSYFRQHWGSGDVASLRSEE